MREAGWLRSLASRLVEPAATDDVLQDVWLAAFRRPPDHRPAAPWLVRIVRNVAHNHRRSERRRRRHDALAGSPDAPQDPQQLAEAAELQRRLANAIARLAAPLQAVVVLCYFRGLDSKEAARQLGVPASTVRTRHQRALVELRTMLDHETPGGRDAWAALALGVLRTIAVPAPRVLASWLMPTALVVASMAALGIGFAWSQRASAPGPTRNSEVARLHVAAPDGGTKDAGTHAPAPALAASRTTVLAPKTEPTGAPTDDREIHGRILVDGETPGHDLVLRLLDAGDARALAERTDAPRKRLQPRCELLVPIDANGVFRFAGLPENWRGQLFVEACEPLEGGQSIPLASPAHDLVIQVRAGPRLSGRLRLADGGPLAVDGRCELRTSAGAQVAVIPFRARADGSFRIPLPRADDAFTARLRVELPGRGFLHCDVPRFTRQRGIDVGERAFEPVRAIELLIVDERGRPIVGAAARIGDTAAASRVVADQLGIAVLPFAPARPCAVHVSASHYAPCEVQASTDSHVVALAPLGAANIRVAPRLLPALDHVRLLGAVPDALGPDGDPVQSGQRTARGAGVPFAHGTRRDGTNEQLFTVGNDGLLMLELPAGVALQLEAIAADGAVLASTCFVPIARRHLDISLGTH